MIGNKKTELLYGIKKVAFTILLILTRTNIHVCCWLKRTCTCGMDRRSYLKWSTSLLFVKQKTIFAMLQNMNNYHNYCFFGSWHLGGAISTCAFVNQFNRIFFFNLISETQSPPTCQIVNLVIRRFRNKVLKRWLVVTRLVTLLPKCWTINA